MLYLFVEGPDDERLIKFLFSDIQDKRIYPYANKKQQAVANLIRTINSTPGWQYIFFTDSDTKTIDKRIEDIKNKWKDIDDERIVVCIEIESWYYAGMNQGLCEKFKIKYQIDANHIHKEHFISLIKNSRRSKSEIQIEAVDNFDVTLACQRNTSFNLFYNKFYK